MVILHVVGARPNFMKAAPVLRALAQRGVQQFLVHTGQHYDKNLSQVFFQELEIPHPDLNLAVGSGSAGAQTANVILGLEPVFLKYNPDWTLVYGDVTSTAATAFAAAQTGRKVAHVEAGLRSFDRNMPEEINRIVTDHLSSLMFTPSEDADKNLIQEGINPAVIRLVGNVMIDTLVRLEAKADLRFPALQARMRLTRFGLLTLHRQSNVDAPEQLKALWHKLSQVSQRLTLVFPVHPRTRKNLDPLLSSGDTNSNIRLIEPLSYLDFMALQKRSTVVITDSGGIQEESTYLGVPCLTLRDNTERPVTILQGTNKLIGSKGSRLEQEISAILDGRVPSPKRPPLWDGNAAQRIADVLVRTDVTIPAASALGLGKK